MASSVGWQTECFNIHANNPQEKRFLKGRYAFYFTTFIYLVNVQYYVQNYYYHYLEKIHSLVEQLYVDVLDHLFNRVVAMSFINNLTDSEGIDGIM